MIRYTTSLDAGDVEGVVACFAEDGWLDSPIVGRHQGHPQLREFAELTARPIREKGARFRHVISNFRVEMEGEGRARLHCYLLDYVTIAGVTTLLSPGEYECEVVRIGTEWLLASRLVRMDRTFAIP